MYAQGYRNTGLGIAPAITVAVPVATRIVGAIFGKKAPLTDAQNLAIVEQKYAEGDATYLRAIIATTGKLAWPVSCQQLAYTRLEQLLAGETAAASGYTPAGAPVAASSNIFQRITGAVQESVIRGEIPPSVLTSVATTAEEVAARARNAASISRASTALQSVSPMVLLGGAALLAFLLMRRK